MHFQSTRKIQVSTSFAQCGASSGGLDTALSCRRVEEFETEI